MALEKRINRLTGILVDAIKAGEQNHRTPYDKLVRLHRDHAELRGYHRILTKTDHDGFFPAMSAIEGRLSHLEKCHNARALS